MLRAARAGLLATTGCQVRPSAKPSGGWAARPDRPPTIGRAGGYTPFPFVTTRMPPISHSGCTSRPPYVSNDPRSASFIDPMSGLEVFRVTGDRGSKVLIDGMTDTGLNFPANLKPENNPRCPRTWNADASLLMLPESKSRSSDPSSRCRSLLIDVNGSYGNSGPWRILRAAGVGALGDHRYATGWFWDPLNPLRAYSARPDGMYEWWPVGGQGHATGESAKLFGWPSGYSDWEAPRGGRAQPSHTGLIYHMAVRRNSDGTWGGIQIDLVTGAAGPFFEHPLNYVDDHAIGILSTGPLGVRAVFNHATQGVPVDLQVIHMTTGERSGTFTDVASHHDYFPRDGEEYLFGPRAGTWRTFNLATGAIDPKGDDPGFSVEHAGCRHYKDTFERHGATGGSTSGLRYGLCCVSNPSPRKGIMGLRLGATDMNQWRYICHHRANRTDNANEVHPAASPDFEYVVFNSNWCVPGVETDPNHVNSYVVLIPDAWYSPNNDGA
jgi:hypothetical protein